MHNAAATWRPTCICLYWHIYLCYIATHTILLAYHVLIILINMLHRAKLSTWSVLRFWLTVRSWLIGGHPLRTNAANAILPQFPTF